ncbi:MAG TPA: pilus assembly protein PilM [Gammaproteobacteria bacterium]|nr:pilus assembly protein PilM [Gammaproteobacteria bacterium]
MALIKKRAKPLLGLDISTSSVKLIELARTGGGFRVEAYAAEAMPQDAIADKLVTDVEACGAALAKAVKRSGTRTREAAVAIGGSSVITKTITMPANISDDERAEQVELQADQHIPFPIEDVRYDFSVLGPSATEADMVDVLLVATRSEHVDKLQAVLEYARLNAKIVDIEAYALETACELLAHQMVDEGRDQTIVVVDFGATSTTFSVLHDRKIIYTRDQAFGGKLLTEEIMRHYGLSYEEAGRAKKVGGLPDGYERDILNPFIDDMVQQVNRSIQFFMTSTNAGDHLSQIVICGGCAAIPGAAERIAERLDTPTVVGDPIGPMQLAPRARAKLADGDSSALVVACGLALRSFD